MAPLPAAIDGTQQRLDLILAELRALRELLTRPAPEPRPAVKAATPKAPAKPKAKPKN